MPRQLQDACYVADWALLADGWARDVRLDVDRAGFIAAVAPNAPTAAGKRIAGAALPGMPNLHSHAFQRSFAGRAEHAHGGDDFWSWRDAMYRAAAALDPETMRDVALYVFARMLAAGYTSVAEFHYLHTAPGGEPYQPDDQMAAALIEAAEAAGIGLTLLPVLYERGGFDGRPLGQEQRRFHIELEAILGWIEQRAPLPLFRWGLAPHSLRAVSPESLAAAVAGLTTIDTAAPIHIHIAEQSAEVEACREAYGVTPIARLFDIVPVDGRWCLVHATHAAPEELERIAAAGAVAGLCPTTEADLGDGIFGLGAYLQAGGRFGVGSDSNVAIDPFAELRLLEYSQRMTSRRRNTVAAAPGAHSGTALWQAAAAAGGQAVGQEVGALAPGNRADLITIAPTPETEGEAPDFWVDAAMFAEVGPPVRDVMVAGRWVAREGRHVDAAAIEGQYRKTLARLRR